MCRDHRPVFLSSALLWLSVCPLFAQAPYLVRDINPTGETANGLASREVLTVSNGTTYLSFDDGLHGAELWRIDAAQRSSLVRDLCPGPCSSSPSDFVELGGALYFFAADGATGRELWRTNGSLSGTRFVRDLCQGSCSGRPDAGSGLIRSGDALFFRARDADGDLEPWTSDGTWAGTRKVAEICRRCNAGIFDLTAASGRVFFRADDGTHGIEVWSSDGTSEGTSMLRDDCPGACSSGRDRDEPGMFTPYGDGVLYWQRDQGSPILWRLRASAGDSVENGHTVQASASSPPPLARAGDAFYFGDLHGLGRVDVPPFTVSFVGISTLEPPVALGALVYFAASSEGGELWRSDGTVAGTQLVADTEPGPASGEPRNLVVIARKLYFTVNNGQSLWISDGTTAGTRSIYYSSQYSRVEGLAPNPRGGSLLFFARNTTNNKIELRTTDGPLAAAGPAPGSADLRSLSAFGGAVLFGAREQAASLGQIIPLPDHHLWRSDGTEAGTQVLSSAAAAPESAASFLGSLVFRSRSEVWTTDGRPEGTHLLIPDFTASDLTAAGDNLFLSGWSSVGHDAGSGFELWSSDGSRSGTRLIKDIAPGDDTVPPYGYFRPRSSNPRRLTVAGSSLFFVATDPDDGDELWKSDGTPDGTALVEDLCPGSCSSDPFLLTSFADRLYFTTTSSRQLWRSDGSVGGTLRFRNLGHAVPDPLIFQNRLFFFAEDGAGHESLWKSDGTAPGTVRIQEVSGPGQPRTAHEPTVIGDRLFFTSWTETAGQELWISDGTAPGTQLLTDIRPGPEGSAPRHLTVADGRLFFTADDGISGQELWIAGTGTPLSDIAGGPASSAPDDLTVAGDLLFFSAADNEHGRELWALDAGQLFDHCVPAANRLCLGRGRFEVTVRFRDQHNGGRVGQGTAIPDSDQSGFFWFFSPGNLELAVKVLDGRAQNGRFWVFFGSLSEVEYDLTVTDRKTGRVRTYHNPPGTFCGQADTEAFESSSFASAGALAFSPPPALKTASKDACAGGREALCLRGGRFQVEARWRNPLDGSEGTATAVPRTDETGAFWFFTPDNVELLVKALDGRALNGKFWIFYGALSNVEYWLTVTDTETGAVKTYHNPPGTYCGRADPAAF